MKLLSSIQIKAIVLLVVFSLNTAVGFACSIGMDLGYNNSHHQDVAVQPATHVHSEHEGHHQPEPAKKAVHSHSDGKEHDHHSDLKKPVSDVTDLPGDDDCCTNEVYKFNSLDKNLTQQKSGIEYLALPVINEIAFIAADAGNKSAPVLHSSRYLFPPPPDILISIQKFQI